MEVSAAIALGPKVVTMKGESNKITMKKKREWQTHVDILSLQLSEVDQRIQWKMPSQSMHATS